MLKRTLAFGAAANQGQWPVQEDGFYVDPGTGLFALADGFGGRGNGDIAAKLALLECRIPEAGIPASYGGGLYSPIQGWQRDLFSVINKKLLHWNESRPPVLRGGCSLIVANVERERELVVTGCGACTALLVRYGSWQTLLSPQSPPRAHPSAILFPDQALGVGKNINPETRSLLLEPGDVLFISSSGIAWERAEFQGELMGQIALRPPGSALTGVASLAANGGGDSNWNQTAVVLEANI